MRRARLALLAALAALAVLAAALPLRAETLTVFAAASLGGVLEEAGRHWTARGGPEIVVVAAGSAVLARQIAAGAPADLYLSASRAWMDWAAGAGAIRPDTVTDLLANRLVLIGHGSPPALDWPDLPERLGTARLAVALTDAVPAGQYARQTLEAQGLWPALVPRLAETDNVRAALALVALGEAPFGIVYATDAAAEPRVAVMAEAPPGSHDPIVYPGAVTAAARDPAAAGAFLDWLRGDAAQRLFAAHGFARAPQ